MVFIFHPALRVKRFKIWKSALQKGVGMGQHGWIIKMFKNVRNHSQTWLDMKKSNVYPFKKIWISNSLVSYSYTLFGIDILLNMFWGSLRFKYVSKFDFFWYFLVNLTQYWLGVHGWLFQNVSNYVPINSGWAEVTAEQFASVSVGKKRSKPSLQCWDFFSDPVKLPRLLAFGLTFEPDVRSRV